jgi:hypothetical protein
MHTKLITLTTGLVIAVAGFSGGSAAAPNACPEAAHYACQPIGARPAAPAPAKRASFQLVSLGPGVCGTETFAVVVNGRRKTILC